MSLRTLLLKRQGISTPVTIQVGGETLVTNGRVNVVEGDGFTITQSDDDATDTSSFTVAAPFYLNIEGGWADSVYGGVYPLDGGIPSSVMSGNALDGGVP